MPLKFEPRAEGFRVLRGDLMIASMETKRGMSTQITDKNPTGATEYVDLPRKECTIHSAGGALSVPDLEEMLVKMPAV